MTSENAKATPTQWAVDMMKQGHTLEEIQEQLRFPSVSGYLNELIGKKGYSVEVVSGFADINPATFHKIMKQKMNPGRNLVLRIAFALELSFEETQFLLKVCNCSALSAARARDLCIMQGITEKKSFLEVNQMLESKAFLNLYSKG